jgi:hypothetical protein
MTLDPLSPGHLLTLIAFLLLAFVYWRLARDARRRTIHRLSFRPSIQVRRHDLPTEAGCARTPEASPSTRIRTLDGRYEMPAPDLRCRLRGVQEIGAPA